MWTDKQGKKVGVREFFSRWRKGIEGITPIQQIDIQIKSTLIMLVGIFVGIIICIFNLKGLWWLLIVLCGAFGNSLIQFIGLYQRRRSVINFESIIKMKGGKM